MNRFEQGAERAAAAADSSVPAIHRYFDRTYSDLASNLALDEALLLEAESDPSFGPILRIWEPERLAIVLGASGRLHDDVHVALCRTDGVEIGRRSSGGGTVLIGPGTLNVTVILPANAKPEYKHVDTSQVAVLETIAKSLRAQGRDVRVEGSGDLTLQGRKFSGSAQRRLRSWFMIHATILNTAPITPIIRYTKIPARQPAYRAGRPHENFLTRLELPRESLVQAIREAWRVCAVPSEVSPALDLAARDLATSRFGHPEWIERL